MARSKKTEEAKQTEEVIEEGVEATQAPIEFLEPKASASVARLEAKRNELIGSIRPLLVTKRQMIEGGRLIRSKVSQEQAYIPIVDEINEIGRKLGHGDVSIGSLRRD